MKNKSTLILLFFPFLKLLIHALTATTYGLHRDEFLYLDQGNHLAWGYAEVPPVIALLAKMAHWMGSSIWLTRMFPALAGALLIYLACRLVRDLGGGSWALIFTGMGLLFSPALLGTNTLFQPVSFNQLCWFLTAYFAVELVKTGQRRWWYGLGIIIGVGILTKYSIAFYVIALFAGVLLSSQRKVLLDVHLLIAMGIALLIAFPNLHWQYSNNWPVWNHLQELQETQLVHMDWSSFLIPQLLFHFSFSIIWLAGLIGLFQRGEWRPYRFLGTALFLTVLLIGAMGGKDYYTIGAYYILFPFGGFTLEQWIRKPVWRVSLIGGMWVSMLGLLPYVLPILPVAQLQSYCVYMRDNYGLDLRLRWEDGQMHDLPQDVADMHGWEEMVSKVAKLYHGLSKEEQTECHLYGGSYGHAGAINYYREKYNLPEAVSLNSSYVIWADKEAKFSHQILILNEKQDSSDWFEVMRLVDSIEHPYARDRGYVYWRTQPTTDVSTVWRRYVEETRAARGFAR